MNLPTNGHVCSDVSVQADNIDVTRAEDNGNEGMGII